MAGSHVARSCLGFPGALVSKRTRLDYARCILDLAYITLLPRFEPLEAFIKRIYIVDIDIYTLKNDAHRRRIYSKQLDSYGNRQARW